MYWGYGYKHGQESIRFMEDVNNIDIIKKVEKESLMRIQDFHLDKETNISNYSN